MMRRHNDSMRTTIDLDPKVHRLAKAIAERQNTTLSKVMSDAFLSIYAPLEGPKVKLGVSEAGFPTFDIGRPISYKEVQDFLDEE